MSIIVVIAASRRVDILKFNYIAHSVHNINHCLKYLFIDTILSHMLRADHAGPMHEPRLGHLPHLAPGERPRVKLQDRGCGVQVATSCIKKIH